MDGPRSPLLARLRAWLVRAAAGLRPAAVARQAAFRVWEWSLAHNADVRPRHINIEHLASTPIGRGYPDPRDTWHDHR